MSSSRKNNFLILGYFGMSNFGDDLFLRRAALDLGPLVEPRGKMFTIASADDFLPSNMRSLLPTSFKGLSNRRGRVGSMCRLIAFFYGVLVCRNLVFWGGSVFSETSIGLRHKIISTLLGMNLIRCFAYGVSVGPFAKASTKKNAESLLKKFSFIGVRDTASLEMARYFNLPKTVLVNDIASGIVSEFRDRVTSAEAVIGISICRFDAYVDPTSAASEIEFMAASCEKIRQQLEYCSGSVDEVKLLVLNSNPEFGDMGITLMLRDSLSSLGLKVTVYAHNGDVDATMSAIYHCDKLICFRLHAAITGYVMGKEFILYEYHEKCANFADEVGQRGRWRRRSLDWSLADVKRADVSVTEYTDKYFLHLHNLVDSFGVGR